MNDFLYPMKMKELEKSLKMNREQILSMILTNKIDYIIIEKNNKKSKYYVKKKKYDEIIKTLNNN